jgi:hypothetical protein
MQESTTSHRTNLQHAESFLTPNSSESKPIHQRQASLLFDKSLDYLIIDQSLCRSRQLNRDYEIRMKHLKRIFDRLDQPPSKSVWVLLRLVFFFFAIEFMYAIETALTVPILSSLHVPESYVR